MVGFAPILAHRSSVCLSRTHVKVAKRYINLGDGEALAISEQAERLSPSIADAVISLMQDYEERETIESRLAHDADALECLIQAREYQAQGYVDVQDWITNSYAGLKTEAAKKIAEECMQIEPREWWQGLKKIAKDK